MTTPIHMSMHLNLCISSLCLSCRLLLQLDHISQRCLGRSGHTHPVYIALAVPVHCPFSCKNTNPLWCMKTQTASWILFFPYSRTVSLFPWLTGNSVECWAPWTVLLHAYLRVVDGAGWGHCSRCCTSLSTWIMMPAARPLLNNYLLAVFYKKLAFIIVDQFGCMQVQSWFFVL